MKSSLLIFLLPVLPLSAHPDPSHTLENLEEHLAATPDDPALLREKATLLLSTEHPDLARPIVDHLLTLHDSQPEDLLLDARTRHAENDATAPAKAYALVTAYPGFAPGWSFLARIEEEQGHRDPAIAALRRTLDLSPHPSPTDVLTCAAWLEDRDDNSAAISVLDQGLARIGVLAGFHQKAIPLEIKLGRYDAALHRIDVLAARFRPSVELSLQRATILEKAGRYREAADSYDSALALLNAVPPSRKSADSYHERFEIISKRKADCLTK
jgi:tetratricopeptide (TPR) repeat protein